MAEKLKAWEALGVAYSLCGLIGLMLLFGWQAYNYWTTSVWVPVSTLTVLQALHLPWATSPQVWITLHALLDQLPLAVALLGVTGIGLLIYAMGE